MSEEQEELMKEVGTIESDMKPLEPKKVKIVKVEIVEVGKDENKKNKKVSCQAEHPDYNEGTITISSASVLVDKKVSSKGLWYNLDKEGNIQKGSVLATFLNAVGVKTVKELEGKELETELEGKYLCFKAY